MAIINQLIRKHVVGVSSTGAFFHALSSRSRLAIRHGVTFA